jgi:hypothetical protein
MVRGVSFLAPRSDQGKDPFQIERGAEQLPTGLDFSSGRAGQSAKSPDVFEPSKGKFGEGLALQMQASPLIALQSLSITHRCRFFSHGRIILAVLPSRSCATDAVIRASASLRKFSSDR